MRVEPLALPGVVLLSPERRADDRGEFFEAWNAARYAAAGLPSVWVQDNVSRSREGVLRGLHGQHPHGQAKLVTVLEGRIWDVAVDLRRGSPAFGQALWVELDADRSQQLYIPPGFAHGFCTPRGAAVVHYKVSAPWDKEAEFSVRWDDPALGIPWPVTSPILSAKDAGAPRLAELPERFLMSYAPGPGA